jgi:hypothetical protein
MALGAATSAFTPVVDNTSTTSRSSTSFTPTAGTLLVISVCSRSVNATLPVHSITNSHAGTWTWTKFLAIDNAAGTGHTLSAFFAIVPASPGAGTVTITNTASGAPNNTRWRIQGYSWSGAALPSNYNPGVLDNTALVASITLPNAPTSSSATVGFICANVVNPNIAAGTGFTELVESGDGNATALEMEVRTASTSSTVSWTVTGGSFLLMGALEIPVPAYTVAASQGSYALTGQAAAERAARHLTAAQGSYSLGGQAANPQYGRKPLAAAQGTYALTGQAAGVKPARAIVAAQGSFNIIGPGVRLAATHGPILAAQGAYALTGQTAGLRAARRATLDQGLYTYAAGTVVLHLNRNLPAAQGSYALTGRTISWVRTWGIRAAQGSYALTGIAAILDLAHKLIAALGSFSLAGQAASLFKTSSNALGADLGIYTLTGKPVGLIHVLRPLTAAQGSYALTGQTTLLKYLRRGIAFPGTYALTGKALGLKASHKPLTATQGAYALTGKAAIVKPTRRFNALPGSYLTIGQPAALRATIPMNLTIPLARRSGLVGTTGNGMSTFTTSNMNVVPGALYIVVLTARVHTAGDAAFDPTLTNSHTGIWNWTRQWSFSGSASLPTTLAWWWAIAPAGSGGGTFTYTNSTGKLADHWRHAIIEIKGAQINTANQAMTVGADVAGRPEVDLPTQPLYDSLILSGVIGPNDFDTIDPDPNYTEIVDYNNADGGAFQIQYWLFPKNKIIQWSDVNGVLPVAFGVEILRDIQTAKAAISMSGRSRSPSIAIPHTKGAANLLAAARTIQSPRANSKALVALTSRGSTLEVPGVKTPTAIKLDGSGKLDSFSTAATLGKASIAITGDGLMSLFAPVILSAEVVMAATGRTSSQANSIAAGFIRAIGIHLSDNTGEGFVAAKAMLMGLAREIPDGRTRSAGAVIVSGPGTMREDAPQRQKGAAIVLGAGRIHSSPRGVLKGEVQVAAEVTAPRVSRLSASARAVLSGHGFPKPLAVTAASAAVVARGGGRLSTTGKPAISAAVSISARGHISTVALTAIEAQIQSLSQGGTSTTELVRTVAAALLRAAGGTSESPQVRTPASTAVVTQGQGTLRPLGRANTKAATQVAARGATQTSALARTKGAAAAQGYGKTPTAGRPTSKAATILIGKGDPAEQGRANTGAPVKVTGTGVESPVGRIKIPAAAKVTGRGSAQEAAGVKTPAATQVLGRGRAIPASRVTTKSAAQVTGQGKTPAAARMRTNAGNTVLRADGSFRAPGKVSTLGAATVKTAGEGKLQEAGRTTALAAVLLRSDGQITEITAIKTKATTIVRADGRTQEPSRVKTKSATSVAAGSLTLEAARAIAKAAAKLIVTGEIGPNEVAPQADLREQITLIGTWVDRLPLDGIWSVEEIKGSWGEGLTLTGTWGKG